jgi:hypothetical protein
MLGVWSSNVKMHLVTLLAKGAISQHKLRYMLCFRWYGLRLSTQVEIYYFFSLAWEGFGKQMKRCIFCCRCPGRCFFQHKLRCINSSRLPGSVMVWSTHVEIHFVSSLEWSTRVETHFLSSLA